MKALQKQVGGKHYRGFVIQPVDIGDKAERENATGHKSLVFTCS